MKSRYYRFSDYLKNLYGQKVYKLPVNIEGDCPNRDRTKGEGGCTFCSLKVHSKDMMDDTLDIREQIRSNKEYIGKKYNASKFIVYFQNYTSTYTDIKTLEENILKTLEDDIVEVCLSTRPDCISDEYIHMLSKIKKNYGVNITVELGLQSANNETLEFINRRHTVEDYIDAVERLKKNEIIVGTHLILNLPGDSMNDVLHSAKLINRLGVDRVKLHSLYISKGTVMGKQYLNHEFTVIPFEEYLERVIAFIQRVGPTVTIERFFSRSSHEDVVFCNWSRSWRYLKNKLDAVLEDKNVFQGDLYEQ